jgi:hypothetical protein
VWDGGSEPQDEPDQVRPRAKAAVVLIVTVVLLLTLVLCCMAVGQLGQLIQLELPPL